MKVDYKTPLQVVANSMRHYHHISVQPEEVDGSNFFPSVHSDEAEHATTCALRFNPKVQTVLALYNLSMQRSVNTGDAIVHYVLFHAFLEVDDYDGASRHLAAFRQQLASLITTSLTAEEQEEADAQVLLQLYFILFHESFHIILRQDPKTYKAAIDTTHELLRDIAAELDDMHASISNEELFSHPKTQKHIHALIPDELSEEARCEVEANIRENLSHDYLNSAYIAHVLESDPTLVEEITCDRQAWLNLIPILQAEGATDADLLSFHLWIFTVLNAMDFNKVLQNQFIPAQHDHSHYDGYRVLMRHKAFKALLRQYHAEIEKTITTEYLDLHKGLESIFRSSVMALERYADDLRQIYSRHQAGNHQPDFARHRRLENEMSEAAKSLFKE